MRRSRSSSTSWRRCWWSEQGLHRGSAWPRRARRWNADCRRFKSTSAAIACRLRSPHSPPNSSNRSTGSACCTSVRRRNHTRSRLRPSDDLRDLREAFRGFEREPFVSQDCVPLLVDLVRVGERLYDLVVRDAEGQRGRRRAVGEGLVPHLLTVATVAVHDHVRYTHAL